LKLFKFASIDVGSNAVRLLFTNVFETPNGPVFRKLSLVRVPIRLGEDAFIHGKIGEKKSDQLIKTMQSFRHLMNVHQVLNYKAVATSAMREASNSTLIVSEIKKYADIDLDIIGGEQEADAISFEDLPSYMPHMDRAVFVDVGGGSTEITYLKDARKVDSISLKIGTVRLLHNVVKQELWEQMKTWFNKHNLLDSGYPILGTGGNINKLLKVLRKQQSDYVINVTDLAHFKAELDAVDYNERISKFVLNPDRADVIIPASQIFLTAADWLNAEQIYIPKTGLSDGIARELYRNYKSK
jgi:exopolyphosphatase/guanosine-5'-triphosphate,3'-diphosphate pyrophosphatase